MNTNVLNLSRKWRSQNFDQIIGQDISVRILKNSLYLNHYFPVYLFAGQRGCGKTSTARVFAAALNCVALSHFQKDPKKSSIPCLVCDSCVAMREGKHPDFIEIDAASHTGVDNIRNIIESSSLLPLIGRKRVYLIDEAHMLSKAAFNAALKILEEPSPTALFILATTNHHKIIDTVRSRCFQLFFTAIAHEALHNHLQNICKKEGIAYENDALDLIVKQTEGSARDALNLLEQARFSHSTVGKESVLSLLGHMSDQQVAMIISRTLRGTTGELLALLQQLAIHHYAAEYIWQRLMVLLRALVWMKHNVSPHQLVTSTAMLDDAAKQCTLSEIHNMIDVLYAHEELFLKTTTQHIFLEMTLLGICQGRVVGLLNKKKPEGGNQGAPPALHHAAHNDAQQHEQKKEESHSGSDEIQEVVKDSLWMQFIARVETLKDPLVISLFKQARFMQHDLHEKKVHAEFAKDVVFFNEWLDDTRGIWLPLLRDIFLADAQFIPHFTGASKSEIGKSKIKPAESLQGNGATGGVVPRQVERTGDRYVGGGDQAPASTFTGYQYKKKNEGQMGRTRPMGKYVNEVRVDVSDETVWKTAPLLLRYFPGIITQVREI